MNRIAYYTMYAAGKCDRLTKFEAEFRHWPTVEDILHAAGNEIERLEAADEENRDADYEPYSDDIGYIRRCMEFIRLLTQDQLGIEPHPVAGTRVVFPVKVAGVEIGTISLTPHFVYQNGITV